MFVLSRSPTTRLLYRTLVLKRPDGPRVPPYSFIILVKIGYLRGSSIIDELAARAVARGYKREVNRKKDELCE